MNSQVFTSISGRSMASLISHALRRVAIAAPGIRSQCVAALTEAVERLGQDAVTVITDCDEEVFRLGYGDIAAIQALRDSGVQVRQSTGLRVGILICDDRAWVFAPTALYVQPEIHSDETPNAVELRATDVDRILWRLSPQAREVDQRRPSPPDLCQELDDAHTEIGHIGLSDAVLTNTAALLETAPPIAFDIARQVRVFEPYLQYVKIRLRGCAIQRRRIEVPKTIQGLDSSADINSRLRTTFELIEKSSEVSSKALEDELRQIRDDLTRPLGEPFGRVLLRSVRPRFDERIEQFRRRLNEHRKAVQQRLSDHLKASHAQLLKHFLPLVKQSPPDRLLGEISTSEPTDECIRSWLQSELDDVFPLPEELLSGMQLEILFQDVTYETLNQEDFGDKLRKAYPRVNWDKPFDEYNAAKACDDGTYHTNVPCA